MSALRLHLVESGGPPSGRKKRSSPWPGRRSLLLLVLLIVWIVWMVDHALLARGRIDLLADLSSDGVVAADVGRAQAGGSWLVTSGTLLTHDGQLWSGRPDAGPPDPGKGRTGSAVLRAVSVRSDFTNVEIHVEMRVTALTSTERTPERAWDGVHLFLHYRDANNLYVADFLRRDGTLAIKRKSTHALDPPADEDAGPTSVEDGIYGTLANTRASGLAEGWHRFDATIEDTTGGVAVTLSIDGRQLLSTVDSDASALRGPGRVGLRGDNADFTVRRFEVVRKD
jgi:hypothetical protein